MRIISGSHGGRRITPPSKLPNTRPTTDLAKEGLFNVLQNMIDLEEINVLELFGGTGNITFELASRGAAQITYIEKDKNLVQFVKATCKQLGFENINVLSGDVFKFLDGLSTKYDLIFADPPYAIPQMGQLPDIIFNNNLLIEEGIFVLEHDTKFDFEKHPKFYKSKKYGTTIFSIFINQ